MRAPIRSFLIWFAIAFSLAIGRALTAAPSSKPTPITGASVTDVQVRGAIDAMAEELLRRKHPERFWDPSEWVQSKHGSTDQVGGYTALAVLALLHAGRSYQEPALADAVEYLQKYPMDGTYAVAIRTHVWAMLGKRFLPNLEQDARWLLDGFSEASPGWDYGFNPDTQRQDHSIRQYGALGLWEAAKRGARIDRRYWQLLEDVFINTQLPDGGWNYRGNEAPPRGSMTVAGLTVLYITQDYLHREAALDLDQRTPTRADRGIERGLAWMDKHFSATTHPGRDDKKDFFYYLYGVERVGLAGGHKHFGGHDWYREGAAECLNRLCVWDEQGGTIAIDPKVRSSTRTTNVVRQLAFAMMFLSRGRASIAINKLAVPGIGWNDRPRDVANLSRWISDILEPSVNWQIVSIDTQPEAWLDAPMLYLSGHESLPWALPTGARAEDVPELARLKAYLDAGGLLLAVNAGDGKQFAQSVRKVGTALYPQYKWRPLPKDHHVYRIHQPVRGRVPILMGLSNGVRELIVLAQGKDWSRTFQARDTEQSNQFHTAANLYFYASELTRQRPRLARHHVEPVEWSQDGPTVNMVRGVYKGNWNPEPQALPVLGRVLARQRGMRLDIRDEPVDTIDRLDPPADLVQISGTGVHEFTDAEQAAIRRYVDAGGVVLFETVGGLGQFATTAEKMVQGWGHSIESINRSRIVTGRDLESAPRLARVTYRAFALRRFKANETAPRLRGVFFDEQPRILFSQEDLSQALLDQPCWGVSGYDARSARDLMGNIIAHAIAERGEP